MKREELKDLIEDLTELYEDKDRNITSVSHSLHSSYCTPCKDYGDTLFENITVVSEMTEC